MINFNDIKINEIQKWLDSHLVNGYYIDDEGMEYGEDIVDLISSGFFNFCGCGQPDEAIKFIKNGLEYIQWRHDNYSKPNDEQVSWEEIKAKEQELFASTGGAYFFYYWADKEDLIEHGGSVPRWLSNKGKILLEVIKFIEK